MIAIRLEFEDELWINFPNKCLSKTAEPVKRFNTAKEFRAGPTQFEIPPLKSCDVRIPEVTADRTFVTHEGIHRFQTVRHTAGAASLSQRLPSILQARNELG